MAWEWSHTQEAYAIARWNLEHKDDDFLLECWAEFATDKAENSTPDGFDYERWIGYYEEQIAKAKDQLGMSRSSVVDDIWNWASKERTCSNGGHDAYVCPDGCHRVSFSTPEPEPTEDDSESLQWWIGTEASE